MADLGSRLYSGSKTLVPAGSHDPVIEYILKEALVWEDSDGNTHEGFNNNKEIGGEFDPGEGYSVNIKRNENGELEPLTITFRNPKRAHIKNPRFELPKIRELSAFYKKLQNKS